MTLSTAKMISTSSKTRLGIHEVYMKQNKNSGRDNGLLLYTGFGGKKFDELRFLIFVVDSGSGKSYTLSI